MKKRILILYVFLMLAFTSVIPIIASGDLEIPPGVLREHVEPAPILKASPEDIKIYEEVRNRCVRYKDKTPLILAESRESFFWSMGGRLRNTMQAYEFARDPELLEAFVHYFELIYGDRYMHSEHPDIWVGWFHYKQGERARYYMPIHGALLYYNPVLRFISAVRADIKLQKRFGSKADAWYKDIVEVEIPAWDKRGQWKELGNEEGWYVKLKQYPDKRTGKIIEIRGAERGTTFAYNKVNAMIESFCLLYRMTGDKWYADRVLKCERFLRNRWVEDDKHVHWNYRDWSGPWDYSDDKTPPEPGSASQHNGKRTWKGFFVHPKQGYYAADLRAIVDCYNVGLIYTYSDIKNLLKTNLDFMWNGDYQNPKYLKINGKEGKGKIWPALSQFDQRTIKLWNRELELFKERKGKLDSSIMGYILKKAGGINTEPLFIKDIPKD